MNIFNRVLIVLLSLATGIAAVAVLLVTLGAVEPVQLAPTVWLRERLEPFTSLSEANQAWTIGVCTALLLIALALLVLELKPPARRDKQMVLRDDTLGRVTVSRDGVAELARREAARIAGVWEFEPEVFEDSRGLRIRGRASLDPESNVPALAELVQERVKASVEQHLGRPVADIQVETQLTPLAGGKQRVR